MACDEFLGEYCVEGHALCWGFEIEEHLFYIFYRFWVEFVGYDPYEDVVAPVSPEVKITTDGVLVIRV